MLSIYGEDLIGCDENLGGSVGWNDVDSMFLSQNWIGLWSQRVCRFHGIERRKLDFGRFYHLVLRGDRYSEYF